MSDAARKSEIQKMTAERAATVYGAIDGVEDFTGKSEEIVKEAVANGASTSEQFAKAFEAAGLKPELAQAAGDAVESHFLMAGIDKLHALDTALKKKQPVGDEKLRFKTTIAREWIIFLLCLPAGYPGAFLAGRLFPFLVVSGRWRSWRSWDDYWNSGFGLHHLSSALLWLAPYVMVMAVRLTWWSVKVIIATKPR